MNSFFSYFEIILLLVTFLSTVAGIYVYRFIAIKYGIVAKKNFRTLHEIDVPKGSGLIFSLSYLLAIVILFYLQMIPSDLAISILLGGLSASIFGFLDDVNDLNPTLKLFFQMLLAFFIVAWFGGLHICVDITQQSINTGLIGGVIGILLITWFINAYNFMDGIDGMAASGTVFISVLLSIITVVNGHAEFSLVTLLLSSSCLAFLLFNWPPARIFMGDAGSVFLGAIFAVFIVYSMKESFISIWTWIIAFSYFGFDTGVTLITWILLVKKWYGAHRSHAYQNLARIWGSHKRVLNIVNIFHFLWALPLAIMSIVYVQYQMIICVLAITPVILWTLKYGPLLSSD